MKKLACCLFLVTLVAFAADPGVSGKWSGTLTPESGEQGSAYMVLKQDGATITGTAGPDLDKQWPVQSGKVDGKKVTIEVKDPNGDSTVKATMMLDGNKMTGDIELSRGGEVRKAKIELTRAE